MFSPLGLQVSDLLFKGLLSLLEFAFPLLKGGLTFGQFNIRRAAKSARRTKSFTSRRCRVALQDVEFDRPNTQSIAGAQLGIGEGKSVESGIGRPPADNGPLAPAKNDTMNGSNAACVQT